MQSKQERNAWRAKGISFMKCKLFSFAHRCFLTSNDEKLSKYSDALNLVKNGARYIKYIQQNIDNLPFNEEDKNILRRTKVQFQDAADFFI